MIIRNTGKSSEDFSRFLKFIYRPQCALNNFIKLNKISFLSSTVTTSANAVVLCVNFVE